MGAVFRFSWRLRWAMRFAMENSDIPAENPVQDEEGVPSRRRMLALGAVACWTWYPLRNADWLRAHPDRNPRTWATAQGVATLPLATLGYALLWLPRGAR